MDRLAPNRRSWLMSRVKSKNTSPEMRVRRAAHALGYRFRLHRKDLPGKPDIVFPRLRVAIFVHGCFWHRHEGCKKAGMPKSRTEFWAAKFERNVRRDAKNIAELQRMGWTVKVLWECEINDRDQLNDIVMKALGVDNEQEEAGQNAGPWSEHEQGV